MNNMECMNCGAGLNKEIQICKYCLSSNPGYVEKNTHNNLENKSISTDNSLENEKLNKLIINKIRKLSLTMIILGVLAIVATFIYYTIANLTGIMGILFITTETQYIAEAVLALLGFIFIVLLVLIITIFVIKLVLAILVSKQKKYHTELSLLVVGFFVPICSFVSSCILFHKTKNIPKDEVKSSQEYLN